CHDASELIPPNSVVLPLDYSGNWKTLHFSNYMGTDRPLVILENYECNQNYFPVQWNEKKIPAIMLGNTPLTETCIQYVRSNPENPRLKIDFVFVLGNLENKDDSCTHLIHSELATIYRAV